MVLVAIGALVASSLSAVAAAPTPLRAAVAFHQELTPPPAPQPLGETVMIAGAEVGVDNAFVEPSTELPDISEVRASITLRNGSETPIEYLPDAWVATANTLRVKDASGTAYAIDRLHPEVASLQTTNLTTLEPGYAGRWTVGFKVPTRFATGLTLEWTLLGVPIAAWQLSGPARPISWDFPPGPTVALGETFTWSDGVEVKAGEMGQLVCGDPAIEAVAHIVTVTLEVSNSNPVAARFPGVLEPDTAASLLWADGSGSDFVLETFVGSSDPLYKPAATTVFIPAGSTYERGMMFSAPRDGRMVDVTATPSSLVLNAPSGTRVLDLTGVSPTIGIDPRFCDLGFRAGPQPHAFGPGLKFDVRGEGIFANPVVQDQMARELLDRVLAGASLFYDANRQSFDRLTSASLLAFTPGANIFDHTAGETTLTSAVGRVYIDTDPDNDDFIYVVTQSGSGSWLCTGIFAYGEERSAIDPDLETAGTACWSDAFQEEEPPPSSGEEPAPTE